MNGKAELLKYLKSQNLMTLATCDKNLWVSTVYYVIDENFNLYFLSEQATIHCQQLSKNAEVACGIVDSRQKVADKKIGVQFLGKASRVDSLEKIKWMLALWNKVNPGFETIINFKNIQNKVIKSRIYKVEPRLIKFFNEKIYGPEGFKVFEFK